MSFERLAELLFPDVERDADDYERLYPERKLPEGAKVTRIAPSPTGFIHLGNLYGALTDERLAHQSGGIFFLRIEDTDAKREVANGAEMIRACLRSFGLVFDEGALEGGDRGAYGPYRQRERAHIYHAFAKKLVLEGKAYPCFCSEEELAEKAAREMETEIAFILPRDPMVQRAEALRKTVVDAFPDCEMSGLYARLAERIAHA